MRFKKIKESELNLHFDETSGFAGIKYPAWSVVTKKKKERWDGKDS